MSRNQVNVSCLSEGPRLFVFKITQEKDNFDTFLSVSMTYLYMVNVIYLIILHMCTYIVKIGETVCHSALISCKWKAIGRACLAVKY